MGGVIGEWRVNMGSRFGLEKSSTWILRRRIAFLRARKNGRGGEGIAVSDWGAEGWGGVEKINGVSEL